MARYPLLMNEVQSGIITASAVACSNVVTGENIDHIEVLIMTIVTLTFITPILLRYFDWLGSLKLPVLHGLVLDQLIFSPIFTTGIITYREFVHDIMFGGPLDLSTLMNADNVMQRIVKVAQIVPSIMIKSWGYWVPLRLLILKFVPPMYHVVIGSAFSFIWQIIMALALKGK